MPGNAGDFASLAFVGLGLAFLGFSAREKPTEAKKSQ